LSHLGGKREVNLKWREVVEGDHRSGKGRREEVLGEEGSEKGDHEEQVVGIGEEALECWGESDLEGIEGALIALKRANQRLRGLGLGHVRALGRELGPKRET